MKTARRALLFILLALSATLTLPAPAKAATFKVSLIDLDGNPLNLPVRVQVFNATGDVDVELLRNANNVPTPVTINSAGEVTINVLDPGVPSPPPGATTINIPTVVRPKAIRLQFASNGLRTADLVRLENSNHVLRVPLPVEAAICPSQSFYECPPVNCECLPANSRFHRIFRRR
jgi:hypothetical protein